LLASTSTHRDDYIQHPERGERLNDESLRTLHTFRKIQGKQNSPVQIIVSDGLNAYSITDKGNLLPYLDALRTELAAVGLHASPGILVIRNGRVRVGYRKDEELLGNRADGDAHLAVVHIIGEWPGSLHRTFSAYITAPPVRMWSKTGLIEHKITRVVSGIAADALAPY
jgi:ethanolamine ammonia-lyase large subunit